MKLEEYFHKHGISPNEWGPKNGWSHTTVYRWLSGESVPSAKSARRISELTDGAVSIEELRPSAVRKRKKSG